jgi:putative ABC transport system permease protein
VPLPQCRSGCQPSLLFLDIESDCCNQITGTLTVDTLRLGRTDLRALDWRLDPPSPRADLTRADDDLLLRGRDAPVGLRLPVPADPARPVVTAGGLDLADPDNPANPGNAFGADGQPVPARVVGDVDALPLIGDEGVLGDLSTFLTDRSAVPTTAEVLVLARSDTPAGVRAELRTAGVESGDVRPVAETRQLLDRDPYAQGLRFFWLAAALVAVIGACAVGVALLSQRGVRGHESAALRVVGVRRRQLRAAAVLEVGVLTGLVAVCGWLGAWASGRVILSVLPLGQPAAYEPGPETTTSLTAGVLPAVASAGVLALMALALLLPMSTGSRPSTLRSGGE